MNWKREMDSIFEPGHYPLGSSDFWPITPLAVRVPLLRENRALNRFLDTEFREMQQLERDMMDVETKEDGNTVTFGCHIAGYTPEELKVHVEGSELVVQGEHREKRNGQSIHRHFERRVLLPECCRCDYVQDSMQCNLDDNGKLTVQVECPKKGEKPAIRQIPIGFKKAPEAKDNQKKIEQK